MGKSRSCWVKGRPYVAVTLHRILASENFTCVLGMIGFILVEDIQVTSGFL
jgi:hypothetical protein